MADEIVASKPCSRCGKKKKLHEFGAHHKGKYGRQSACLMCEATRNRAYHKSHPEVVQQKVKRANKRSKERLKNDPAYKARRARIQRKVDLKRRFNLTHDDYLAMQEAQNGVCAICGNPETMHNQYGIVPLAIDHDHKTGEVRGLLCSRCNRYLSIVEDGRYGFTIDAALAYLERYRSAPTAC